MIEAGERLPGLAAVWIVGSVEERSAIVKEILEPGRLHYDVETKEIAAITPRPAFLPVLRLLEGVIEYEEATGTLVTSRWRQRNRRATATLTSVNPLRFSLSFPRTEAPTDLNSIASKAYAALNKKVF
ncbi:MAG TPA: hypothetical protein VHZ51_23080 [Ktedonobacteraceae bacterium]|nr:hypothetical protein [Ktedonobacteraceae bacterium]